MTETTTVLLDDAIADIDAAFGKGYAREHPELIVGFLQAERLGEIGTQLKYLGTGDAATTMGAIEFLASRIGDAIEEGLSEVARKIDFSEIADAIEPVQRDKVVVRAENGKEKANEKI
jgi:hypothetical protein